MGSAVAPGSSAPSLPPTHPEVPPPWSAATRWVASCAGPPGSDDGGPGLAVGDGCDGQRVDGALHYSPLLISLSTLIILNNLPLLISLIPLTSLTLLRAQLSHFLTLFISHTALTSLMLLNYLTLSSCFLSLTLLTSLMLLNYLTLASFLHYFRIPFLIL